MDASYQDSVHLVKRFQRKFLEIDQSEMTMAAMFVNGLGPNEQSLKRTIIQRRFKCEKL
jgi:hypothetical protein